MRGGGEGKKGPKQTWRDMAGGRESAAGKA